jgi:hypothetical protein
MSHTFEKLWKYIMNNPTDALDTFLATWKEKTTDYYIATAKEDNRLRTIRDDLMKKYKLFTRRMSEPEDIRPADYVEAQENYKRHRQSMTAATVDIIYKHNNPRHPFNLSDFLDKEVEKKKEKLIFRVEKKGGKVVDGSYLFIASDGNINGYIQCEDRQVTVRTIMAEGEVQCLHYRVLVK